MMEQNPVTAHEPNSEAAGAEAPSRVEQPYLKVFGPDIGVFDYDLPQAPIVIGRSEDAELRLPHPRVSETHATINYANGKFIISDSGSELGFTVNKKRVESHILRHGDSVQISLYVLQFRTHPALPGATAAAAKAKLLLRAEYGVLPSTIRLRYRTLAAAPEEIFKAGDTLRVGHGGLLIPTSSLPEDSLCLELHLAWPTQVSKRFLGENMGAVEEEGMHWMCVKLHSVTKTVYEATVGRGEPGPWVDVIAT
jgi:pSer/pThr/pTyr-binding forkhead associated (FHA) protein